MTQKAENSGGRRRQPAAGGSRPAQVSLPEVHGSIAIPHGAGFWRKMFAFAGPGYLVAVGYMDPGNWATDLAGGARFGYTLLSVIMISNLMAILLQALAARLGIASGRDLAQACRDSYSPPTTFVLWVLCEIAIAACDLAEVLGAAIALNLLFGLPLIWGVCLTALDVLIVLFLQHRGFRYVEALVVALIVLIAGSFAIELWLAQPDPRRRRRRLHPEAEILAQPGDALHRHRHPRRHGDAAQPLPALVDRPDAQVPGHVESKREAIRFATIDSSFALMLALFINAAILVMAAATFHGTGTTTSPTSATPTSCCRRCSARRWRARCSRWRCSARDRTPRSPARSPARS